MNKFAASLFTAIAISSVSVDAGSARAADPNSRRQQQHKLNRGIDDGMVKRAPRIGDERMARRAPENIDDGIFMPRRVYKGTATSIRTKVDVAAFSQIPAGEFMMGSAKGGFFGEQKPVHGVRISKSFEMSKYEVTQEQWQAVMGNNPSYFKGATLPVETVSWIEVQEFIKKLNAQNDGYAYRLPTEAEWEYSCRAGRKGDYVENLDEMAWYEKNSGSETHSVGQKKANSWGLYDMQGNVSEWCQDWFAEDYYSHSPSIDPTGPKTSKGLPIEMRVLRGCSRINRAAACQAAFRGRNNPDGTSEDLGFRLVRTKR